MSTNISYVDETWNPVQGCSHAGSPGCDNCYAKRIAHRFGWGLTGEHGEWTGEVRLVPEVLEKPLRWRKPRRVLVPSMGDIFHESVPSEYVAAVFGVMAASQQHTYLLLTKRIERVRGWLRWMEGGGPYQTICLSPLELGSCWLCADTELERAGRSAAARKLLNCLKRAYPGDDTGMDVIGRWPLPNVLIGVTVEDQRRADERLPVLAEIASLGWRTWVSVEPLLGPTHIWLQHCPVCGREHDGRPACDHAPLPKFVAVGAETGSSARFCDSRWIGDVVYQCASTGVRCHVKQLSARDSDPAGWPEDLRVREML